jgi:hypothetical protein
MTPPATATTKKNTDMKVSVSWPDCFNTVDMSPVVQPLQLAVRRLLGPSITWTIGGFSSPATALCIALEVGELAGCAVVDDVVAWAQKRAVACVPGLVVLWFRPPLEWSPQKSPPGKVHLCVCASNISLHQEITPGCVRCATAPCNFRCTCRWCLWIH